MIKLFYTPQARDDLQRLHDFIAADNPPAAARISRQLRDGIARLRAHPRLGMRVDITTGELAPEEIRDWLIVHYIVRYLILEASLVVLRIWHEREDRPAP